jgi:NADH-quinone oxidoreductase subunit F
MSRRIIICGGTGCLAKGAAAVHEEFARVIAERGPAIDLDLAAHDREEAERRVETGGTCLVQSGCQGFCQQGTLVTVEPQGFLYVGVSPDDAAEIVDSVVSGTGPVVRLLYEGRPDQTREGDLEFFMPQRKLVLAGCGKIDPDDIRDYIARGGYQALAKAITRMTPDGVIDEVEAAGLRGRGGAGFPAGKKWRFTRDAQGDKKYVIINGDEGDPGAFMDGYLMEGDPHRVLEGMIIAAYAIGADEGFAYVRAEYPRAVRRLRRAMAEAERYGLLGDNILGTSFSFRAKLKEGAGAFVCGEETALIASIEGRRGMPRPRPPFPAQSGLWGCPTCINNVETLANLPGLLARGAKAYRESGTERSPGTKTFALAGQVNRTGLVEVPMGVTLREIVFTAGGGIRSGRAFKAVQIGGPSGGCLTDQHLDLPLDYESLSQAGAMIGSGGLVVMDEGSCMVDVARFFMSFVQSESCGKCVPCREGTRRMLELLTKMTQGRGTEEDLELLEELALAVRESSLCGLGKTAPNPVLSTLRYFRDEYLAHVREKRCPAGSCVELMSYVIDASACTGCGLCARACPSGGVRQVSSTTENGERAPKAPKRRPYEVIEALCQRCDACRQACPKGAVTRVPRRTTGRDSGVTGAPGGEPAAAASD